MRKKSILIVLSLFIGLALTSAFYFTVNNTSKVVSERSRYAYQPANSGCSETVEGMMSQIAKLVAYLPVIPDIASFEFENIEIVGTGIIWHCWCYSGGCH